MGFESHENTFLKVFQRPSLCPEVLVPTDRHPHTARTQAPGARSATLWRNKTGARGALPPAAPRTGNEAGARGEEPAESRPARPPPREGRGPGSRAAALTPRTPRGRRSAARTPRRARRSPLAAPRPDSAASEDTAASPPGRPPSPARPALTSGVLERDIYGQETLNFPEVEF